MAETDILPLLTIKICLLCFKWLNVQDRAYIPSNHGHPHYGDVTFALTKTLVDVINIPLLRHIEKMPVSCK